ncbi:MAG: glycine reductase [Spirochaetes bacterium]|nr:MAG: glycine reductase [Spirochaetota bacterium]
MKNNRFYLERGYFEIKDLVFGEKTSLNDGVLTVNRKELTDYLLKEDENKNIKSLELEIVKPGEDTRIVHILDTVQVGIKIEGEGEFMPGHLSDPVIVGNGKTNLITNLAIMECAELPWAGKSSLLYAREAIVDMTGPAAGYSPFSETFNLVLRMVMIDDASDVEYDDSVRNAGIRCSKYLAALIKDKEPDRKEIFDFTKEVDPSLPKVAYIYQVQNQGTYSNTFLYGKEVSNLVPTRLSPTELLDGCLVSGNYVWPCFKIPSFIHANIPVVLELSRMHGKTVNFVGVVFVRGHNNSHFEKQRVGNIAAQQVRLMDADGVIISWEGGGNAATDAMLALQTCERWGIKAVPFTFEFGGPDGTEGILLVDDVPEAKYIVSTGSIEKPTTIPRVKRVAGGDVVRLKKETGGAPEPAEEERTLDVTTAFYCGANQSGIGKLAGVAY